MNVSIQKYNIPDIDKCLRIVLDYSMEEDDVETSIFGVQ